MNRPTRTSVLALVMLMSVPRAAVAQPVVLSAEAARRLAIERSSAVVQGRITAQIQAERFRLSARGFFPQLSITVSGSESVVTGGADSTLASISADLTQPLYDGGRTRAQRALERSGLDLALASQSLSEEQVGDAAWSAYNSAVLAELERDILTTTVARAVERLEITRQEAEFGRIREIDLLQAELEVADLQLRLQEAEQAVEQSLFSLRRSLSYPPNQELELTGGISPDYQGLDLSGSSDDLNRLVLQDNLQLLQVSAQLDQASQQLQLSRRWWQPVISATVSAGATGSQLPLQQPTLEGGIQLEFVPREAPGRLGSTRSRTSASSRTTAADGSVDVLPALETRLSLREAELAFRAAEEQLANARDELSFSLAQLLQEQARQRERLTLQRRRLNLQDRQLGILRQQRALGQITESEVIAAEISRNQAQISLLQDVLVLVDLERELERLAALPLGGLSQRIRVQR